MAMAMEPIAESKVLGENPQLTMRVGAYTYEIKRNGKQSFYSVTDGKDTISLPIVYAFGQGKMGQTYVLQRDGKFYESLVSFYNETKGLDFTIGAPRMEPTSLNDAVGRLLTPNEVSNCFALSRDGRGQWLTTPAGKVCAWRALRELSWTRRRAHRGYQRREAGPDRRFSIPGG